MVKARKQVALTHAYMTRAFKRTLRHRWDVYNPEKDCGLVSYLLQDNFFGATPEYLDAIVDHVETHFRDETNATTTAKVAAVKGSVTLLKYGRKITEDLAAASANPNPIEAAASVQAGQNRAMQLLHEISVRGWGYLYSK